MNKKDMDILIEQYYKFVNLSKRSKNKILNTLSYCKEIRDTAYPMKDSKVTELQIVELTAHKDKDFFYVNGSLSLVDGDRSENRTFEAYIMDDKKEGKTRVFMDITRLCVEDEPKFIRTSDDLVEDEKNVMSVTMYASGYASEEKIFSAEFPKNPTNDYIYEEKAKQLSAL